MEYSIPCQLQYKASLIVQVDMILIHIQEQYGLLKNIPSKNISGVSVKYTVHVVYICCPSVTNTLQMRTHFAFTVPHSFTQKAEEVDVDLTVDF